MNGGNTMRTLKHWVLTSLLSLPIAVQADGQWAVGAGTAVSSSALVGSDEVEAGAAPFFFYEGERLSVSLDSASYTLYQGDSLSLDVLGALRDEGFDADDNQALAGLDEREEALDVGVSVNLAQLGGVFSLAALTDVSNRHQGQEVSLSYGIPLEGAYWEVTPSLGVAWKSSDLVDYYYGVEAKEARPGRAEYQGEAAMNGFVGLDATLAFSRQWLVTGGLSFSALANEISDSPLIEDDREVSGSLGVIYLF
jgi:outer membrane scaffolding protein for murein synthesis (MipA/OmpV family)